MSEKLARLMWDKQQKLFTEAGWQPSAVAFDDLIAEERAVLSKAADLVELEFFGSEPMDEDGYSLGNNFWVENGYGHNTDVPFVALLYNGRHIVHMRPEDAQALAANLFAAAEASLGDAFLVRFFRDKLDTDMGRIAYILGAFRDFREGREESEA